MILIVIKIYLVLLFIQTLIRVINRNTKSSYLSCGLVMYCGDKPANLLKIALLLKYNEARGNHATGISINDIVYKDAISVSQFLGDYNGLFLQQGDQEWNNYTILAHARQASSGSKDRGDLAHPHAVYSHENANNPVLIGSNATL